MERIVVEDLHRARQHEIVDGNRPECGFDDDQLHRERKAIDRRHAALNEKAVEVTPAEAVSPEVRQARTMEPDIVSDVSESMVP
jgi:hypothetical protein